VQEEHSLAASWIGDKKDCALLENIFGCLRVLDALIEWFAKDGDFTAHKGNDAITAVDGTI
jgi:hypothetical protein